MTAADLIDAVRDDQQTELSRLGSSKTLYADTRGEMEPDVVLAAAAAREQAAHETFDAWSDDANDDAAALLSTRRPKRPSAVTALMPNRSTERRRCTTYSTTSTGPSSALAASSAGRSLTRKSRSRTPPLHRPGGPTDREYVPQRRQRRGGPPRRGR